MTKAHQNRIVRDAQRLYARICEALGYDLDLSNPGEMHRFYEYAGDDEDTIRRAVEICREEGSHFTGRSVEHGYGEPADSEDDEGFCDDSDDFESFDEAEEIDHD